MRRAHWQPCASPSNPLPKAIVRARSGVLMPTSIPCEQVVEETAHSLSWAARAKRIRHRALPPRCAWMPIRDAIFLCFVANDCNETKVRPLGSLQGMMRPDPAKGVVAVAAK